MHVKRVHEDEFVRVRDRYGVSLATVSITMASVVFAGGVIVLVLG